MSVVLHLLRVTIEALSPLSIGSGDVVQVQRPRKGDDGAGPAATTQNVTALARDANGLPTAPGATTQGVLRHLYTSEYGEHAAQLLFGFARDTEGEAGRLFTGFGSAHDQNDNAVTGLIEDASRVRNCPILGRLRQPEPLLRDHVKLNERHVAHDRNKFDRRAVPAGTRFSIEFSLWGAAVEAAQDKAALERILGLFHHPAFRLGGAGRHGYGRVVPRRASYACPDLGKPVQVRRLRDQAPSVALPENLLRESVTFDRSVTMRLKLTPVNPWRIGGQADSLTGNTHGVRRADGSATDRPGADLSGDRRDVATILREPVIIWANGKATLRVPGQTTPFETGLPNGVAFAVPGSAIKGPLMHRTLFHWNRQRAGGDGMIDVDVWLAWNDEARRDAALAERANRPEPLARLFGAAKERDADTGRAGRAYFEDGVTSEVQAAQAVDHNVIDRFTGGVITGLLYAEEVLVGGSVETTITLLPPGAAGDWPSDIRDAFLSALRDLCHGRLAIGAKSLGFCTGEIVAWEGGGALISAWQTAWAALIAAPTRRDAA